MLSEKYIAPRLKCVVLTRPWTKLDNEVRVTPGMASRTLNKHPIVIMQVHKVCRGWGRDQDKFLA